MFVHRLLLAALLLVPRASHTQAPIPFEFEDARLYVPLALPASAGRDGPAWLILDTGASTTSLDVAIAPLFGLAPRSRTSVRGAGRGSLAQGIADGVPLRIGEATHRPDVIAIAAIDTLLGAVSGRRVDGIVGAHFFTEHVVELDFRDRTMRVTSPDGYRYTGPGVALPIEMVGRLPVTTLHVTLPNGERVAMRALVDLGAKASLLVTEPFIARHPALFGAARTVVAPLGVGVGGETRYRFARVPRMTLGDGDAIAWTDFVAGFSVDGTLTSTGWDALLGAEFLEQFRLTIDYARQRIYLEPRDSVASPPDFDMSGLFVLAPTRPGAPTTRRFIVRSVIDGSPAAAAGLRAGDEITAADGRPARTLRLSQLRALLRRRAGDVVRLEIRRDGTTLTRELRLRRLV